MLFCNRFLRQHISVLDPELTFFIEEDSIHLDGYISAQNNEHWSSINSRYDFLSTPFTIMRYVCGVLLLLHE